MIDPMIHKRNEMIVEMIEKDRMKLVSIAKIFNLSHQRIQQIYRDYKRKKNV